MCRGTIQADENTIRGRGPGGLSSTAIEASLRTGKSTQSVSRKKWRIGQKVYINNTKLESECKNNAAYLIFKFALETLQNLLGFFLRNGFPGHSARQLASLPKCKLLLLRL
jgi:hypothetical protein